MALVLTFRSPILSYFLYMVWGNDLTVLLHVDIPAPFVEEAMLYPIDCSWHPSWTSVDCRFVGSFLDSVLFPCSVLYATSTTLFWLPQLFLKFWNWEVRGYNFFFFFKIVLALLERLQFPFYIFYYRDFKAYTEVEGMV